MAPTRDRAAGSTRLLAYALGASALALVGCGRTAPDTRGYGPVAPIAPIAIDGSGIAAVPEAVEFYFYVNSDNDILGIRGEGPDAGRAENQGELLYERLREIGVRLPARVGLHVYLDRGAEIRAGDELSSETFDRCAGAEPRVVRLGETDSRDPAHLRALLERRCAKDAKRFVILWSHGEGFRVQKDFDYRTGDSADAGLFHVSRLIAAIPDGFAEAVLFDSCSMASLEIAALVAPKARYLVASQFLLPNEGLQYAKAFARLAADRATLPLLREIRAESEARFREIGVSAPLAIVELAKLPALESAFRAAFADALPADAGAYAEFRRGVLRGEKDGDVLFLLQRHARGALPALAAALDGARGSLHFALPSALPADAEGAADLARVAEASAETFRTWSEKFPNWGMLVPSDSPARPSSVPLPAQPSPTQGALP